MLTELKWQRCIPFLDSLGYQYTKFYLKFGPSILSSLKPNLSFSGFQTNKQIQKLILHLASKMEYNYSIQSEAVTKWV